MTLNPRNENYAYNQAQMFLASRDVDDARPILERLKDSSNPQIAMMASTSLAQAEAYKAALGASGSQGSAGAQVLPGPDEASAAREEPGRAASAAIRPARFLKGKLMVVDCSAPPGALLTVAAGTKTWKMTAKDSRHMIVIGADALSCDWKNKDVALNYRETSEGSAEIISLELQ